MRTIVMAGLIGLTCCLAGCGDATIPPEEMGEVITNLNTIPGVDQPYDFKDLPEVSLGLEPPMD